MIHWYVDYLLCRLVGSLTYWVMDPLSCLFLEIWFCRHVHFVGCLIHPVTVCAFIGLLIHWLADTWICWFTDVSIYRFIESLVHRFVEQLSRCHRCHHCHHGRRYHLMLIAFKKIWLVSIDLVSSRLNCCWIVLIDFDWFDSAWFWLVLVGVCWF